MNRAWPWTRACLTSPGPTATAPIVQWSPVCVYWRGGVSLLTASIQIEISVPLSPPPPCSLLPHGLSYHATLTVARQPDNAAASGCAGACVWERGRVCVLPIYIQDRWGLYHLTTQESVIDNIWNCCWQNPCLWQCRIVHCPGYSWWIKIYHYMGQP